MTVRRPTLEQMMEIVESFGMSMTPERVGEFLSLMEGNFAAYDLIDQMPDDDARRQISAHARLSAEGARRTATTPGT